MIPQETYTAIDLSTNDMPLNKRMSFVDFRRYETSFAKRSIRNVYIDNLPLLKSLQGLPTSISGNIDIKNCNSLRQLDLRLQIGAGVDDQMIEIQRCNHLSSLKNFPVTAVDSDAHKRLSVILDRLPSVTRLQDLPMSVYDMCVNHVPITSLSGIPKTIHDCLYLSNIGIRNFDDLCTGISCGALSLRDVPDLESFAGIHMKFDRLDVMTINMTATKRRILGMMDLAQLLVHLNTHVTFIIGTSMMDPDRVSMSTLKYHETLKQFSDIVNDGSILARSKLMKINSLFNDRDMRVLR